MLRNGSSKGNKTRESYDADFKQELTRLLASGRSAKEISETFGIAENLLYRWKRMATMKTKHKTSRVGIAML
ncbi:transposase [Dyadobacter fanqingshengii]|uniref:transposase n=1 Tax=Dyadobacter fanqingshengii TaxID=2906443 RepID=UPI0035B5D7C6